MEKLNHIYGIGKSVDLVLNLEIFNLKVVSYAGKLYILMSYDAK